MIEAPHTAPIRPDFHCALLWLRALEILIGNSPRTMLAELETPDLFEQYRSPWRA